MSSHLDSSSLIPTQRGSELPDPRGSVAESTRPWGSFAQFAHNESVTVKVISVLPGERLSLQRHSERGELWIILDGPVEVTVGDDTWAAGADELVWVPCGELHRMCNTDSQPARVLEVAFGTFDEDDIERVEDDYGRG